MNLGDDLTFGCLGLLIIILLFVIIKMIWNRCQGRDELDGFF
ncbi:hypothetical protein Mucpa_5669 [Mucilaginibacter paludis DSM 18603]|uniref:Uncharacterized protein n=1 Tax=Mucilaginibacter paludis DSM 18603 TaxID=714943 RepID=H1Y3H0_9SPHI|nr:hypothetical protein Mucpa_5669 [Mucilaginibacter paludis DSM 18603]